MIFLTLKFSNYAAQRTDSPVRRVRAELSVRNAVKLRQIETIAINVYFSVREGGII